MAAAEIEAHLARLRERIGLEGPPVSKLMEQGALINFAKAVGETNPLYIDEAYARASRFGAIIAAPTYVSTFAQVGLPPGMFDLDLPLKRSLHSDDVVKNYLPIKAGDVITTRARYADVYIREGGSGLLFFQAAELTLTNQDDRKVSTVRVVSVNFN